MSPYDSHEHTTNAVAKGVIAGVSAAAILSALYLGWNADRIMPAVSESLSRVSAPMFERSRNENIEALLAQVQCEYVAPHKDMGRYEFAGETAPRSATKSDLDFWFRDVNAENLLPSGNLGDGRFWRMVDERIASDPAYAGTLYPCPRPSFLATEQ